MKGRLFAAIAIFAMLSSSAAFAQANEHVFVEGHVFDSKTLRPLPRANVALAGFKNGLLYSFSVDDTDGGGFFTTGDATPNLDFYDQVDLVVQCTLSRSRKRFTYTTSFYAPLVGGRVYTRDLYIKIPDGDTGCVQAPFTRPSSPKMPR